MSRKQRPQPKGVGELLGRDDWWGTGTCPWSLGKCLVGGQLMGVTWALRALERRMERGKGVVGVWVNGIEASERVTDGC